MGRWLHWISWIAGLGGIAASAFAADPFEVSVERGMSGTTGVVVVHFKVPAHHHLYEDQLAVAAGETRLRRLEGANPVLIWDAFSEEKRASYTNDFSISFALQEGVETVEVSYQGCDENTCFFPQTRSFRLGGTVQADAGPEVRKNGEPAGEVVLQVGGRAGGYLRVGEFLAFLDRVEGKNGAGGVTSEGSLATRGRTAMALFGADPVEFFRQYGVWWTLLIILLGGLLLNLTPCVLPMIPINLAIIGAGAGDGSRARGFALGGVYGIGMALVYGLLGLVVVLTGSQFGAVNARPEFNTVMAVVFAILGLAMFDVLAIDFSRFQGRIGGPDSTGKRGRFPVALVMGGVAALLAGACVAPVVIAVLLLSGKLYVAGAKVGVLLPFLLGVGMALPWPIAGAGLSFLPKPGAWMNWVKKGFGIFILVLSVYYGFLAWRGWFGSSQGKPTDAPGVRNVNAAVPGDLEAVLGEARQQGRPVFIDFWATWCKNCHAMDATTFRDPKVKARLSSYLMLKVQAERPQDEVVRRVLERFEVQGLPAYVVLKPQGLHPGKEPSDAP